MALGNRMITQSEFEHIMGSAKHLAHLHGAEDNFDIVGVLINTWRNILPEEAARHYGQRMKAQIRKEASPVKVRKDIIRRNKQCLLDDFRDDPSTTSVDASEITTDKRLAWWKKQQVALGIAADAQTLDEATMPTEGQVSFESNCIRSNLTVQMNDMIDTIKHDWLDAPHDIVGDAYDAGAMFGHSRQTVFNAVKRDHRVDPLGHNPSGYLYTNARKRKCRRDFRMDAAIIMSMHGGFKTTDFEVFAEIVRKSCPPERPIEMQGPLTSLNPKTPCAE